MFNLIFLVAWFVLAATVDAHAGPVVAAIGAIATVISQAGIIGQLIVGVALNAASTLLQKALAKKPKQQAASVGVQGQLQVGGDNPLSFVAGTTGEAGQLEYVNSWGNDGGTPNAYLTLVISLSDIPITALRRIFVNGQACTFDSGPVTSGGSPDSDGKGYVVNEFKQNDTPYMWVKFYDGTQTAADAYLRSKFGSDADRPWLSDMIGRGVAYAIVTMRVNRELFSGVPNLMFEVDGIKLYDIRKDTTAGGDGSHRWDDSSTYEFSDNPKVIEYNIIRGIQYDSAWLWGGQNISGARLPPSTWMAAANECDVLIDLADETTEKQFRSGSQITVDQVPLDVIDEFDKACNGRTIEVGGFYKAQAGAPPLPVYAFGDEDIVVTKEQSLDPFPGLEQTQNGIHATYPEPEEAWADKDAPPRYFEDYEEDDDGRRLVADVKYPVVPYATQVQRLMEAAIRDGRRFRKHQFFLPPEAWLLEPVIDTVSWTSARNGYDAKTFMIGSMFDQPNCLQQVLLQEVDPSDFDWNTDLELPTSVGPLSPMRPAAQVMTGWQVDAATLGDNTDTGRRPAIAVGYAGNLEDVSAVRVQVKLAGADDSDLVFDGVISYGDPATNPNPITTVLNGTFVANTNYEVRGRFIPFSGRASNWSAWLPVKTPDIRYTYQDLANEIQRKLDHSQELIDKVAPDLKAALDDISAALLDITTQSIIDRDNVNIQIQRNRQVLGVAVDTAKASIVSEQAVRASADSALAVMIDALSTTVGGHTSTLSILAESVDGIKAQFGVVVELDGETGGFLFTGIKKLDGSASFSFQIDGDLVVAGSMNGDRLVANSVEADRLAVLTLSAITADIGLATAGRILLGNDTDGKIDIDGENLRILISAPAA
jgi:hypothetical protein